MKHLCTNGEAVLTSDEKGSTTGWFCCADDCDCDHPCDCDCPWPCPCDCDCVGVAAGAAPSELPCTCQHCQHEGFAVALPISLSAHKPSCLKVQVVQMVIGGTTWSGGGCGDLRSCHRARAAGGRRAGAGVDRRAGLSRPVHRHLALHRRRRAAGSCQRRPAAPH